MGRCRDMIISGGLNVYPREIESLIDAVPGVVESAVIGVPHPDLGEAVIAVVVAQGGDLEPLTETIMAEIGRSAARFKLPKHIFLTEALPRNAMGKVEKARLRTVYARTFEPPAP